MKRRKLITLIFVLGFIFLCPEPEEDFPWKDFLPNLPYPISII